MAIYTAPRAVLPIFNPSDFVVVASKKGTSTHTFEYWVSQFQTINDQLVALQNQLLNIGTAYQSLTPTNASASNGQTSQIGVIPAVSPTGTSPFPMALQTMSMSINTFNTNVNMQYGLTSNGANIASNVHINVNTQNYSVMFCCAFQYQAGAILYIYQTYGGNTAQAYPANLFCIYIK